MGSARPQVLTLRSSVHSATWRPWRTSLQALLRLIPRSHAAASGLLVAGLGGVEALAVLLLVPLVQLVGVGGPEAGASAVTDALRAIGLTPTLGVLLTLYVGVAAAQGGFRRWQVELTARIEQGVVIALRRRLCDAIARMRWSDFTRRRSTDLSHLVTAGVDRVGIAAHHALDIAVSGVVAAVYFAVALRMSPAVTGVITIAGAGLALAMRARINAARTSGARVSDAMMRLHGAVSEQLWSMKTAKSFGAEARHAAVLERLAGERRRVTLASARELGRVQQYLAFGSVAGLAVVVYVSARVLAVPTAELLVLLFIFARLMPRLTGLYERAQILATLLPAFDEVRETTASCEAAAESEAAGAREVVFEREVRLDRVTFFYDDRRDDPALEGVDLSLPAGSTTAIVGPSGAGKSTIADLLLGLIEPAEGDVLVDGVALRGDGLASWRAQVAYVPQDTFLFHDTVRANLLWARPDADDGQLWHALALADAAGFVGSWPLGFDTMLGDRGVLVSGGERQRLALARALLRHPRLLVLDEATSALDAESEARILSAIDRLHGHTTIVLITHRLAAAAYADRVYVVEGGRVVESNSLEPAGPPAGPPVVNGADRLAQAIGAQDFAPLERGRLSPDG